MNSSSIEAMFDASRESYDPLKPSRECSCRITNYMDVQTIQLKIVDLRLVRYGIATIEEYAAHFLIAV